MRASAVLAALAKLDLKDPRILDLGCGAGYMTDILSHFATCEGTDQAIAVAKKRYPHLNFWTSDASTPRHNVGRFDVVVSLEVIEHIEDQPAFLRVCDHYLKPGGYLILTTPNARITMRATDAAWRKAWLNQPVELHLDQRQLVRLLSEQFEVQSISSIVEGFGREGVYRFLHARPFLRLFRDTLLKYGFGLHLVAVARKRDASA
jgi:cyclopropane fatty-acyl-phospholipid synthase-like methyltransferase